MVLCIVGLVIFGILGIFSSKYRRYFKLSLHCLTRQLTLKACDTEFDNELKAKLSAALGKRSPALGRFFFRRFVMLSWILLIVMIFSIVSVGWGAYNYLAYGNCNGPNSSDFCVFNALGGNKDPSNIKTVLADDDPTLGNPNAQLKIVEVGCFSCPYTKEAEAIRHRILEKYGDNVSFTFRSMPLPNHNLSWEAAEAADCALEQGKYWEYHDKLFEYQYIMSQEKISDIAAELNLDMNEFNSCTTSGKYKDEVQKDYDDTVNAGIFATPTYFVNGKPYVGLKAFAESQNIPVGEISGSCSV